MKKLFIAFAFVLGFAGMASAQTKTAVVPSKEVATKPIATTKTTTATNVPLKKDGTSDKPFRGNK
jgi:hypothetical protein